MTAVVAPNGDGGSNIGGRIAPYFHAVTRLEDLQCPGGAVEIYHPEELIQINFHGLPGSQEQGDAIVPRCPLSMLPGWGISPAVAVP
jgi:hypothetical protein